MEPDAKRRCIEALDHILVLPRDSLRYLLSFLEIDDLNSISCTNKSFHKLILEDSGDLWRSLYAKTWNCNLSKLDETTNWRKECLKRAKKDNSRSLDFSKIGNHLLTLGKKQLSLKDTTSEVHSIRERLLHGVDALRFQQACKMGKIPDWLIEGTYFNTRSEYTYTAKGGRFEDQLDERCFSLWDLYTPSGGCLSFRFYYSFSQKDDSFKTRLFGVSVTFGKENILIKSDGLLCCRLPKRARASKTNGKRIQDPFGFSQMHGRRTSSLVGPSLYH